MNIKKLLALVLVLTLTTGCAQRVDINDNPNSISEPKISSSDEAVDDILPITEEPNVDSSHETESIDDAPQSKSEDFPAITPEESRANPMALSGVQEIDDNQAIFALNTTIAELKKLDNTSIVWGPGIAKDEKQPSEPVMLQQKYGVVNGKQAAYFVMPESDEIYLTFDEGYETGYTASILDTLKEKNVKAVFFVTLGYVKSQPELVKRMIDEGHIVGNHSSAHPVGGMPTMDTLTMTKDVMKLHNFVNENFGYEMTLFRAPEGTFSEQSLAVLSSLGYTSIFWSFAYKDWETDNQVPPAEALEIIKDRSHPGAIYLLHAVSETNARILGTAIDELEDKGYSFSNWDFATH